MKKKECFPQKKDGTIDTCEVMKENEELKAQIRLIQSVADANADKTEELKAQIEKMKSDLKNLDTSGTKGFVLERFWDLLEKWGVEE